MRPPVGAPSLTRRTRILLVAAGVLVVLLLGGSRLLNFYVDYLWFGEVGFRSVQLTRLFTQIVLFGVVGLVVGGLVALALWLAYRYRPVFVPVSGPEDPVARYRTTIIQRLRVFAVGVPVVVGLVAGLAAPVQWQTVQTFLHGTPFGQVDPEFGNDIAFYAFTLPFLRMVLNWLFVAIAICFVLSLITHYVFGGIRLSGRSGFVSTAARAQLAILAGVFVLLKAVAYWFDRYDLLWSNRNSQTFYGATYTDLNAVLPAKLILLIIAVVCALAFFFAAFRQNLQIPAVAVVMLVISSILVGTAFPLVLQQFVVAPNANEREAPSIERNIAATRDAFGIGPDTVEVQPYAGQSEATPAQVRADTDTIPNIRLLDPGKLNRTFTNLQQRRNFYGFAQNLDIDRYTVDGQTQDYVVALREIDVNALFGNQQDWINRHLVYTHGNGFVSAPANQVNEALEDAGGQGGLPVFNNSDTQTRGDIPVDQPRIYYGELLDNQYSIVGAEEGTPPREYDSDEAQYTYTGAGGVPVGGIFDRAVFALAYGDRNILFNSSINDQSKIMYVRNPRDRVQAVAPWLKLDNDPYPAVVDGRIQWIIDGYTTLQDYPYAERVQLGDATADSRIGPNGQQLPNETVSYLRNSVKATVDAYDGTVRMYAFDEQDPVLKTWMNAFPGTVEPRSAITPELQAHLRYPEDQFKVQRELLTRYHVDDPGEFFSTVAFWDVPSDPTVQGAGGGGTQESQPPYYLYAGLPGQDGPSFQLTSALVSLRRQFLASYVSASSDPETYGKITVLELPNETQTLGPQQVQAQFLGSPEVSSELNLLRQNQTTIDYGNLLTLPVAGGLLYIEPVYIERAGQEVSYPQLARVLVSYGGRVGYNASLSAALDEVFGAGAGAAAGGAAPSAGQPAPETPPAGGQTPAPATPGTPSPEQATAAQGIRTALSNLKAAQQAGDFAKQGEALAELDRAVAEFQGTGG
ncbi:UPF0182 family protein [Pseudonocardia sp. HH130630-07]|uniref:UPF0182 family protein n=1 Tax=Pseudonocardia sp. HH130630-07 TaxID=1690815 RepID=UPI000814B514|nr:UPF0182 family protein [Pseudonocardia sp. HH130630-07]ANY05885.1 hypothetical protein AFB00_05740 [Pseudonocardia sp. HH130630-07]